MGPFHLETMLHASSRLAQSTKATSQTDRYDQDRRNIRFTARLFRIVWYDLNSIVYDYKYLFVEIADFNKKTLE